MTTRKATVAKMSDLERYPLPEQPVLDERIPRHDMRDVIRIAHGLKPLRWIGPLPIIVDPFEKTLTLITCALLCLGAHKLFVNSWPETALLFFAVSTYAIWKLQHPDPKPRKGRRR
jgi:hypothetical protein